MSPGNASPLANTCPSNSQTSCASVLAVIIIMSVTHKRAAFIAIWNPAIVTVKEATVSERKKEAEVLFVSLCVFLFDVLVGWWR